MPVFQATGIAASSTSSGPPPWRCSKLRAAGVGRGPTQRRRTSSIARHYSSSTASRKTALSCASICIPATVFFAPVVMVFCYNS
jgi:hypothetical protein